MRGIPNMGMRNQVFPSIIHRLVAFTPFSAPESHQSNGMRAWNIHMPFSQSVERLPPICSISAANCLRPWPPGRLPECQAPISFTSVISKESSSPEPTPRTCLRKAHDAKRLIGNYKTQPQTLTLPSKIKNIVLNNLPQLEADGNEITLEGYQAVVLEV